ncbi:MAG: ABC transporter ATP-binding protein [Dehalococcoidia bacterium]
MLAVDFKKTVGSFELAPRFTAEQELVVLFGPSGSGKSLTLRTIAGLMRPDSGRIELPEQVVFASEQGIDVPARLRNVGYVVQDLALFPHMTVAENIAYPLAGWTRQQQRDRVAELVALLGLDGLEQRLPRAISGGQQQRVALGRALAARPGVLLLDEPFTALDGPVRNLLRREVARLKQQLNLAALFVTHDLQEAFALADQIAIYDQGRVLQFGPRERIFRYPASARVAELLDARNIFPGTVRAKTSAWIEVETPDFIARARPDAEVEVGDAVWLSIRPEHVIIQRHDHESVDTVLEVEIEDELATGNNHRLYLRVLRDGEPSSTLIEGDVPAHPYSVMGIASRRRWRVSLSLDETVVIPGRPAPI